MRSLNIIQRVIGDVGSPARLIIIGKPVAAIAKRVVAIAEIHLRRVGKGGHPLDGGESAGILGILRLVPLHPVLITKTRVVNQRRAEGVIPIEAVNERILGTGKVLVANLHRQIASLRRR